MSHSRLIAHLPQRPDPVPPPGTPGTPEPMPQPPSPQDPPGPAELPPINDPPGPPEPPAGDPPAPVVVSMQAQAQAASTLLSINLSCGRKPETTVNSITAI